MAGRTHGNVAIVYSNGSGVPIPNTKVSKVENTIQQRPIGLPKAGAPKLSDNLPKRPGYGTIGKDVILWANYVEMAPPLKLVLYRYHVVITPVVAGRKLEQIIRLLLEMSELVKFKGDLVTDFKSTLISRQDLKIGESEFQIPYRAEKEDEASPRAKTYQIRLQPTGTLSVAQLTEFLTSTDLQLGCTEKLPIIQALNILVRHYAKSHSDLAAIGSAKTFSLRSGSNLGLGGGLTALRGFFSSVRVATCRILVNVNISHGAFYDAIPLDQLIQRYRQANRGNYYDKLLSFLCKVRVKVTHLPERKNKFGEPIPKSKTISGFATKNDGHGLEHRPRVKHFGAGPGDVEFFLDKLPASSDRNGGKTGGAKKGNKKGGPPGAQDLAAGNYVSVLNFFKQSHNRTLNPDMPVVNLGNLQNPMYFPAEVCVVLPGQAFRSLLDPRQTQYMMGFAVRKPYENAASIRDEGLHTVGLVSPTNKVLAGFGISVAPNLITVAGRVLASPSVKYPPKGKLDRVKFGTWNMIQMKFNTVGTLQSWAVLTIGKKGSLMPDNKRDQATAESFLKSLRDMGINAPAPFKVAHQEVNDWDDPAIDGLIKIGSGFAKLIVVVIPAPDPVLYKRIKRAGDVTTGVHTVCVHGTKFHKAEIQYFANVALKVNLKIGGTNQLVGLEQKGIISENKTMIVGIDVTHPSPGSAPDAPSVAGMVASVDNMLGQWPAALRIQEGREEMVLDLGSMLKSRLKLWIVRHENRFPENILVYRDGVSEGQYASVLDKELPLLREACTAVYPASDTKKGLPHITIVIVGKRHHTRFYPTKASDADNFSNPLPGTVVDRGVTEARNWDFFMQAHAAIKGTARPAHYYVVLDEIFTRRRLQPPFRNAADMLEELTHHLCYMYGRATKAVSICTPAYYAHLVCERARCYLSRLYDAPKNPGPGQDHLPGQMAEATVHPNLRDSMFYV